MSKIAPVATGDCYEAALHYLMDHRQELHLRLVHAEIGKILEINNIHRYTFSEAADTCLKFGHYGPWGSSLLELAL